VVCPAINWRLSGMIHSMRRPAPALLVSAGQREVLESVSRSPSAPHREVVRARALLMAADGLANTAIARALSVSPASVSGWRARFTEEGLVKFAQVREGRGRKKTIPQEKIDEIVDLTLNYRPQGETHWSCRTTQPRRPAAGQRNAARLASQCHPRFARTH